MILLSAISTREANTFFSLFISKKRVNILSFLSTFSISTIDFSTLLLLFLNRQKRSKVKWRSSQFWLFFSRKQRLSKTFFSWITQTFCWFESIREKKKQLKTTIRFYKKREKKNDEKRKNLSFIEINEKKVETFQRIWYHRVRESNRSNKTFENKRKNFENQENSFTFFLSIQSSIWSSFFWLNDFLLLEINIFNCSDSEIKIRTIRHFSIEHRTERTSFVFENKKIEHTFNFFFRQYKQRVSSFRFFKLYVLQIVFKWVALCALDCRYSNQI